jgi:anti-anti-sigma regulatory factor
MLLLLREKAESSGKQVTLSGLAGTVKQVLDIANFGKLFAIKA